MDRWRGGAEQLLPLWADGEAEPVQDAEEPRGASGPRRGRRAAAAGVVLALAACALAAPGFGSRGAGGGRPSADELSRAALEGYEDATGGLSADGGQGGPPTTDEQAKALLESMLSHHRASQGGAGSAATAGGRESEPSAAAEAAAAAQEAEAQPTVSSSAGAAATMAGVVDDVDVDDDGDAGDDDGDVGDVGDVGVAADAEPTTEEATTSVTSMIITDTAAPTTAQETAAASTTSSATPGRDELERQEAIDAQTKGQTAKTARDGPDEGTGGPDSSEASSSQALSVVSSTQGPDECGLVEPGIDYPGNDLRAVKDVLSAEACCSECANDIDCVAWVWGEKRGEDFSDTCFLKGGHPRGQITRVVNTDVVSGQPTQVGRSIPTLNRTSGQSLFCFSLMLPNSYESDLLEYQYENAGGVFGCDEYAIYSNVSTEVAPGCSTLKVDMDLHSEMGGEFGTALNTGVFMSVWQSVVGAGRYELHDWTVKLDPDSVFFAPRLRLLVQSHKEVAGGVYLNNCEFGLHGPLEVFSTNAVTAWFAAQQHCQKHFWDLCSGDCNWGEDMFIDQCLNYTGVQRDDDFNQLLEDHCAPPEGWDECLDPSVVAFHPFKTVEKQKACIKNAIGQPP